MPLNNQTKVIMFEYYQSLYKINTFDPQTMILLPDTVKGYTCQNVNIEKEHNYN